MIRAARDVDAMMGRNEEPTKEDMFYGSICVQAVLVLCDTLVMLGAGEGRSEEDEYEWTILSTW